MREQIINLLQSTQRPGIDDLIPHMDKAGFFTAPCSSAHHLCKEGGLAEHSLNVYMMMWEMWENTKLFDLLSYESIIISSLLHDLGKASYRGKANYVPNILKSGKASDSKPFETNKDRLYIPHEVVSVVMASQFIELTEDEEFAIMYHNGNYTALGREIQGKERQLQQFLHFCDMFCSRFIEKGKEE
jgi:23S rRNA maturation-related 3'-5' exoribonuclease YhaM